MTIDKSLLLAALAPETTPVDIDGLGDLYVRQLTVEQSDAARIRSTKAKDAAPSDFGLHLLLMAVVDADGNPVFDDPDLASLRGAAGPKVDKLVAKVLKVNGFVASDKSGN